MRRLSVITLLAALVAAACTASAGAKQFGPYRFDFKLVGPQTVKVTMTYTGYKREAWASVGYTAHSPTAKLSFSSAFTSKMKVQKITPASSVSYRGVLFSAGPQVHGTTSTFTVTVTDPRAAHGYCIWAGVNSLLAQASGDVGEQCWK